MTNEFSGGCLCGAIRFKAISPTNPHTCSCDICQKHTGAQSAAWVEFSAPNVQWTGKNGKPATYRSSPASSRAFCPRCGSSIGAIDDGPVIALLTGIFDNPNDPALAPEYHSFEDMKPEWWQKLFPDSQP
ncbi:GFA family protein [Serratia sp. 14-2641]|uniref:GFA family protein n=1 Tax=Serratia sp. 14-2641 TaxID=1841657 RepID=UPI0009437CE8|nr:GFA family protein [Serratia sp. 14-2641]